VVFLREKEEGDEKGKWQGGEGGEFLGHFGGRQTKKDKKRTK
jgi:hypothetical protein